MLIDPIVQEYREYSGAEDRCMKEKSLYESGKYSSVGDRCMKERRRL